MAASATATIKTSVMTGLDEDFTPGVFLQLIFVRHQTVVETECPDYLPHFRDDVRCKDYKEEGPEE